MDWPAWDPPISVDVLLGAVIMEVELEIDETGGRLGPLAVEDGAISGGGMGLVTLDVMVTLDEDLVAI